MPLTNEEHELAARVLRDSRDRLTALVSPLATAQWRFRAAEDSWSIAEIAEHVVMLEEWTLANLDRALHEPAAPAEEAERVRGKEQKLLAAVPDRSRRVKAPPGLELHGRFATPADALAVFAPLRENSLRALDREGLHRHLFPHFVFRQMSCYQWLIMLGAHAERHCRQMEEVMGDSGFPQHS